MLSSFSLTAYYAMFGGCVFQHRRYAIWYQLFSSIRRLVPFYVWSRLHTGIFREKRKTIAFSFNFAFRYIDIVLSPYNSMFSDYVDRIYNLT